MIKSATIRSHEVVGPKRPEEEEEEEEEEEVGLGGVAMVDINRYRARSSNGPAANE